MLGIYVLSHVGLLEVEVVHGSLEVVGVSLEVEVVGGSLSMEALAGKPVIMLNVASR